MSSLSVKKLHGKVNVKPVTQPQTYIFVTEEGKEIPAVEVTEETVFTATANDIRAGAVAATSDGVTIGTKDIPAYNTTEGIRYIPAGSAFTIPLSIADRYNFTKLQVIICAFNTSLTNSTAAVKVCVDGGVYAVGSADKLAQATADHTSKTINLGITNEGATPCVIRYFTYKEEL